jgi:formate hydrogenlyase transcriptional activator
MQPQVPANESQRLEELQRLHERLIACSRDCIKILDLEGRLLFVNEGGAKSLEICDLDSVLHEFWIEFWECEDRVAASAALDTALRGGTGRFTGYFETRIHRTPKWWDVVVSPILDASGKVERLLAISRDVTEHKRIEFALREANQFNNEIIEGAAQGIIVYDAELRYVVFNPFMQRLTGKSADQVLGKVAMEVFPRLRTSGLDEILRRALNGEVVHANDILVPSHSAEGHDVWESCTFAPHRDAHGKIVGVIGLVHDTTDRHLAEQTFRDIVVGTAGTTGGDFFPSLVRHLASALRVRYAFITDCDDQKHAKAVAFWKGDGFGDNFEFDLAGTPCESVLHGETCHHECNLQALFPEDTGLVRWGVESYLGVPMAGVDGRVIGHIAILDDKPMQRDPRAIDLVRIFAARAAAELKRQKAEKELHSALEQVQSLQKKLEAENVYLQEEIRNEHNFDEMVGSSPALLDVLSKVERIASTDSTVLIHGETGTGKELVARALHSRSRRKHRPLVKVNCGAIPAGLVESEMFGHVKGAFTGALDRRIGRFELANGGTLFLDEVGELPLDTQVKLLRVLQEQEFEPVGSGRTMKVDVRIIAASNRDLQEEIKAGRFRSDLFYRLNVLPLTVPPLRERQTDVPALVLFFLARFAKKCGKEIQGVSQQTMDLLLRYPWPGNIRELQNVIERGVALCQGQVLQLGPDLLPLERPQVESQRSAPVATNNTHTNDGSNGDLGLVSLEEVERHHILTVLQKTDGVIDGQRGAAKILDLHPNTLRSRMKKLGIKRASHESS